jgi:hypothetical protein
MKIMLALSMFVLGILVCVLVLRPPADTAQHTQLFCDVAHTVPAIPAVQCGGLNSCERMALNMGVPVPCPK